MNLYENDEEYEYHVDTNIEHLIIRFTNLNLLIQTQNRTRLTTSQKHEQSSKPQQTWDQLDDNSKSNKLTTKQTKSILPIEQIISKNKY